MVKLLLLVLVSCMLLGIFIAGGAIYYAKPGPLTSQKTLIISAGASSNAIAKQLGAEGIIHHPHLFWICTKFFGYGKKLHAGEYAFTAAMSPADILEMLATNRAIIHRFTVPEGTTTAEILRRLEQEPALLGSITPGAVQDGDLLPETYFFSYGEQKKQLLARMRLRMQVTLAELWLKRQPGLPLTTPEEALTLASIVEKETGIQDERGKVASVFINRLRKNMKLQSDPTVIYALTNGEKDLNRPLTKKDLRIDSVYNTYAVEGLPPTPITNPGKASLVAVLNPPSTNILYFVADGKGGHRFAATLDEHNKNVAIYRKSLEQAQ